MIEASELKRFARVRHGFFTRKGGHSSGLFASLNCGFGSGDDKPTVARNRATAGESLGVASANLLTAWQWHSSDVVVAEAPWDVQVPPKGDAVVTRTPGLAIAVLTADCAPILFADRDAGVIGAAHAGWKGALGGVGEATVAAMEKLGARRSGIIAVIGPTISQANYEVGPGFAERFLVDEDSNSIFFQSSTRPGHHMFDLPGYLGKRLTEAGIGMVIDLALCTYADKESFFSFRRATHKSEKNYGRQISAIALAG